MPITITHQLHLNDAERAFPELASLVKWRQETLAGDEAVALVVPQGEWPRELGVDTELLLLVLPDELAHLLPALATGSLDVYNDTSDDLLSCRTVLSLVGAQTELQMDGCSCQFRPDVAVGKFFLAIAAAENFVLACHDLGTELLDTFQSAWQSACGSSDPNYRPYQLWSPEQLAAAARGEDIFGSDQAKGPAAAERLLLR